MEQGYELYCLADALFYESPLLAAWNDKDFDVVGRPVPEGWDCKEIDDWRHYAPAEANPPKQGWKIHISACLDNADHVLASVWEYCVPRRLPFKFIRNRPLLLLRNAKNADRGSSGKFVTIYPADETQLEVILTELGGLLQGQLGPYVLSDLRWGQGPLYVRYGGFAERWCIGPQGEQVLAIEEPGGGLVPDLRRPAFNPPAWVTLPTFLEPHLAARNAVTVDEMPYRIERALHFSNAGGLYAAVDKRTGEKVVLKEARPHAGLTLDGLDAVARLDRERDNLERLAGLPCVPAVRGAFTVGEHHFLALEFVEATPLRKLLVHRYPLIVPETDDDALADYTAWAVGVYERVEAAVAAVHDRGVVIGDIHPYNVLIRPDGQVVLIDFEVAAHVTEKWRPSLAAPGFRAPDAEGFDIDRYALSTLRLFLFLPITEVLSLDRSKADELAREIATLFPVPSSFLTPATGFVGAGRPKGGGAAPNGARPPRIEADAQGWRLARESMARAILASATLQRDDRLFPGDIRQFRTGGLNLAYGAAGVLYALGATGAGTFPHHEEWLLRRATRPKSGMRLGFYDGLHGVAYVLDRLGRRDDALAVLNVCRQELAGKLEHFGLDLYGGLAGIGLNLAHFWEVTGDSSLGREALGVAELVADRLGAEDSVSELSGGEHPYAGLVRGSSGPALLFIRLYERLGESVLLDLAATALRQDLRRCLRRPTGSVEVNEGWRTMPYLADGSVGIGMVLCDYLAHRRDESFADAAADIRRTATCPFTVEPGLFYGKAGMILYLSRGLEPGTGGEDPVVAGHIRRLAWHALAYKGHLAFPGEQLLRLSMDLASGTAGVLLAVGAALHDRPVGLPFLGPIGVRTRPPEWETRRPVLTG